MNRFVRRFCIFRWRGRRCLDFARHERVSGVGTGFAWVTGFSEHMKANANETPHPLPHPICRPTLGPAV
jgi:hypothetical protein